MIWRGRKFSGDFPWNVAPMPTWLLALACKTSQACAGQVWCQNWASNTLCMEERTTPFARLICQQWPIGYHGPGGWIEFHTLARYHEWAPQLQLSDKRRDTMSGPD